MDLLVSTGHPGFRFQRGCERKFAGKFRHRRAPVMRGLGAEYWEWSSFVTTRRVSPSVAKADLRLQSGGALIAAVGNCDYGRETNQGG